jgi:hypothetical protein
VTKTNTKVFKVGISIPSEKAKKEFKKKFLNLLLKHFKINKMYYKMTFKSVNKNTFERTKKEFKMSYLINN